MIHRASDAGNKDSRDEHRRQDERNGDNRTRHLGHGLEGGILRTQPLLDVRLDGLDHNDGIIHHQTDGQHHAEKRQGIDGKSQHREERKGADEGNRNGDERNEGRPPTLKENKHHNDDEHHGLEQGLDDFLNAVGDGERGVEGDRVLEPCGKLLRLLLKEFPHLLHGIHRIRAGQLVDGDDGSILALEAPANIVNLAPEFNTGDILDPHNRSVWIGANNDVFKFLDRCEASRGGDCEGENLPLGDRLAADLSGGVHFVLRVHRLDHFWNCDVQRGEAVGPYPDAHSIFARAENAHAADAWNTGKRVVDVDVGVVRQKGGIELAIGRRENENSERRGEGLLDSDAVVFHLRRKLRRGLRLPHLRENLIRRRLGIRAEDHIQVHDAGVGIDRIHVFHALDAAHLLLDGRGNGLLDREGVGAHISCRYLNLRRNDVRILRDGETRHGNEADNDYDDGDNHRHNRPADEEIRHGVLLRGLGSR